MENRQYTCLSLVIFLFFVNTNQGNSQLIDNSALANDILQLHLTDFFRLNSPGLKIAYEKQIKPGRYIGAEIGYITDFDARIYRTTHDEKGVKGFHIGTYYLKAIPVSTLDYTQIGFTINYSYRNRTFNSWIFRNGASYLEKLSYNQYNHNFGLHLKWSMVRRFPNGLSFSIGLNPGVVMENVTTSLPENASVFSTPDRSVESAFLLQKDAGIYVRPNLYFESTIGIAISK